MIDDDRAERLFTYGVWTAASVALLAYVGFYGRNVPYYEDWVLVPVLTGSRPFSLSWLLEMTVAEHRFILAKALLYPMWLASGGDFRVSMYFTAFVLIALALACITVARRLRGRASFADAFFPLTMLSLSHGENTLFFAQVFFVAPASLLTVGILLIASGRWVGRSGLFALLCICLVLMPLNGGIGMLFVPPLILWYGWAARTRWRSGTVQGRREAALLSGAILATVLLAGLYFVGYHPPDAGTGQARTWQNEGRTIVQVFGLAFGAGGHAVWPWLGPAVAALCVVAACALGAIAATRPDERLRASGLLACLAATCAVPLAIGYARAPLGPDAGLPARYALLMAPALACIFMTAVLYGGAFAGRLAQVGLVAAALAMLGPNVKTGIDYGRYRAEIADSVLADILAGVSSSGLAQRYANKLLPENATLEQGFETLRAAGRGPFAGVRAQAEPAAMRELRIPQIYVQTHDAAVVDGVVRGAGPDPYVVLYLTRRTYVAGIRIRFTLTTETGGPAELQAFWMLSGRDEFDARRRNTAVTVGSGPQEQTVTFWIYDTIDHLRLDPAAGASVFRLIDIVALARQ